MSDTLDSLRDALATSPRELEYLDLDQDGWSQSDRDAAFDLLLEAAKRGDPRAPDALTLVCGPDRVDPVLDDLLDTAPDPGVRVRAAMAKLARVGVRLTSFYDELVTGRMSERTAGLVLDLWLRTGNESLARRALEQTTDPHIRALCADRLWHHHGLHMYPTKWWTGLGLIKAFLDIPVSSFQLRTLDTFLGLIGLNPASMGYRPCTDRMSPALRAARADLKAPVGPIDEALLSPLTPDERAGLLVKAAEQALSRRPRGVQYVAHLDGERHRDLLEWARDLPSDVISLIARDALVAMTNE